MKNKQLSPPITATIKKLLLEARKQVVQQVNTTIVYTYSKQQTPSVISEKTSKSSTLLRISDDQLEKLGRHPKGQTLSDQSKMVSINIFASQYKTYLSSKEELKKQIDNV
ncbi:MAG: hypothetical protein U9R29_03945 [Thermodesulfobacteriota bacterium]|nr:hypothetical protein [Thermodesulfobacteriota bacterium]